MASIATVPQSLTAQSLQLNTQPLHHPTFLMCPPQWYDVNYVINPWMAGNLHNSSRDLAFSQWKGLYNALREVADVRLLHPEPECPDMVFLGHGALVHQGVAALASFHHGERRVESGYLRAWLEEHGFLIWDTPRETAFEGEGDAAFSAGGQMLWAGHGVRTSKTAHRHVADAWHLRVRSLNLHDPRFYHLDTCFAPLAGGYLLYYPGAFDESSLAAIHAEFPVEKRLAVTEKDAAQLACSVLPVGRHLITGEVSEVLLDRLRAVGFSVHSLPLGEFLKGGGGARSLALRLSDAFARTELPHAVAA
jgi:N-dimethylarginine dimethylaminohydrolase